MKRRRRRRSSRGALGGIVMTLAAGVACVLIASRGRQPVAEVSGDERVPPAMERAKPPPLAEGPAEPHVSPGAGEEDAADLAWLEFFSGEPSGDAELAHETESGELPDAPDAWEESPAAPPDPGDFGSLPPPPAYPRPAPGVGLFEVTPELRASPASREAVTHLTLLARNFPARPEVTQTIRARALALALTLNPDHREALVANGQLARGVWPEPLPVTDGAPPSLEDMKRRLTRTAGGFPNDDELSAGRTAALYLTALAEALPPSESPESPPVAMADWSAAFPDSRSTAAGSRAGLRLTRGSARVIADGENGRPVVYGLSARAAPLPEGEADRPLLLVPPPFLAKPLEPLLKEGRALLLDRHSPRPAGWRVEFAGQGIKEKDRNLFFMGMVTLTDALASGEELSDSVVTGAAWRSPERLRPAVGIDGIFRFPPDEPPLTRFILHADQAEEISDRLILHPEDERLLRRFVFLIAKSPEEVLALSRARPAAAVRRGLEAFERAVALAAGSGGGFTGEAAEALAESARWFPANLSARFPHERLTNTRPARLSPRGTARWLEAVAEPLTSEDRNRHPFIRPVSGLQRTEFAAAWETMDGRRALLDAAAAPWLEALEKLADLMNRRALQPPSSRKYRDRSDREIKAAQAAAREEGARFRALRGVPAE